MDFKRNFKSKAIEDKVLSKILLEYTGERKKLDKDIIPKKFLIQGQEADSFHITLLSIYPLKTENHMLFEAF